MPDAPAADQVVSFSLGRDAQDAYPKQMRVDNFAAFAKVVCDRRATAKGKLYFCAPFATNGDGKLPRRSKDTAGPRRFLPLDVDYIEGGEVFSDLLLALQPWRFFAYTTASSTPERPRLRIVAELSRAVDRDEGMRIGLAFQRDLLAAAHTTNGAIKFDESVYRAEQPCFGLVTNSEIYPRDRKMHGSPLDVDALLATAAELEPTVTAKDRAERIARDDPLVRHLAERGYLLDVPAPAGKLAIRCPNAAAHSEETSPTSTVVLLPHFNGVKAARIKCLHASCASVTQEELQRLAGYSRGEASPAPAKAQDTGAPIDGAAVLGAVLAYLKRFVVYPDEHAAVAHALWIVHTHLMDQWHSTPRLAFLSPEPNSGKTRALEITEVLVPRPVVSVNATPAYLFRKVSDEAGRPTILYDEIDTLFGPKARTENEELRGLINAGHRRGATAGRCVVRGKLIETEELPAYCAVALAGIGDLPDTIITRAVVIGMRRRAPSEQVEAYRVREHAPEGAAIREQVEAWVSRLDGIGAAYPTMPATVTDRAADVWEPLLAVADAAGGEWPDRARVSVVSLVSDSIRGAHSLGIRLLGDLRAVFGDRDAVPTTTLLEELCGMDEAPWGDLKGGALNARSLASILRRYKIRPRQIRVGAATVKGYTREDLHDAWQRYLPPSSPESETSETSETPA